MYPSRSDVIYFYSSGDLGIHIRSCHREGYALQISIPLTREALSNRRFPCITVLDLSSLCLFAVNKFGSPWNFSLNWLKNNVKAKCCIHMHERDETMKTCIWVSP